MAAVAKLTGQVADDHGRTRSARIWTHMIAAALELDQEHADLLDSRRARCSMTRAFRCVTRKIPASCLSDERAPFRRPAAWHYVFAHINHHWVVLAAPASGPRGPTIH